MTPLLFFTFWLLVMGSLAVWVFTDLYFHSILFDPIRKYGDNLVETTKGLKAKFGYLLNCSYCFSHWVGLVVAIFLWLVACAFSQRTLADLPLTLFCVPIIARLGGVIRDNTLPPLSFTFTSDTSEPEEIPNTAAI
jgi:hypothetical protein